MQTPLEDAARRLLGRASARCERLAPHATWIGLGLALAVTLAWFLHVNAFSPGSRFVGDARLYIRLGTNPTTWHDALNVLGERSVGFPLLIYAGKRLLALFDVPASRSEPDALLNLFAGGLLVLHVTSTLLFIRAARGLGRRSGLELPLLPLGLLLVHPGLIAHTTVLLTDTLCADLLMLALCLLARATWARRRGSRVLAAGLAGGFLGMTVLARPSYAVPLAVVMLLAVLVAGASGATASGRGRGARGLLAILVLGAAGFAACVTPAVAHCQAVYGKVCLRDPDGEKAAIYSSLNAGKSSPRLYWTRYAKPEDRDAMAILRDPYLTEHWAPRCRIDSGAFDKGLLKCFAHEPLEGTVFLFKKSLALLDHYYIDPYAVDVTPSWVRWVSRPFGALAFLGLGACLALLAEALPRGRRPARMRGTPELLVILIAGFSVAYCGCHCIFQIEPRYSFGALPGLYLGLAWALAKIPRLRVSLRYAAYVGLFWLGVIFYAQTAHWDRLDPYLPQIENGLS
jgi:hypothetical protein